MNEAFKLAREAKAIFTSADLEGRDLTPEE